MEPKKIVKRLNRYIDENRYASAASLVSSPDVAESLLSYLYWVERNISNRGDYDEVMKDIEEAIETVIKVSKLLYDINWTRTGLMFRLMPDEVYDNLLERYKSIKDQEPFPDKVFSGMRDESHDFPELVGTLDKAYEIRDISDKMSLEKFLKRIMTSMNLKRLAIGIGEKYDGTSISATFSTVSTLTIPLKATSRGDFIENKGVDMSRLVIGRKGFGIGPFHTLMDKMGIQYEVMITEDGRNQLSKLTGINYSTRRAAATAAVKRLTHGDLSQDEVEKFFKCISLVPLNVNEQFLRVLDLSWFQAMDQLGTVAKYGDITPKIDIIEGTLEELLVQFTDYVAKYAALRNTLPYNIDGLVVSVVDEAVRKELGRSNNKNRWQIAYKFNALVRRTKVIGILTTQGRQGFLGHNILFDPIEFNGVQYDKAPVNNVTRFNGLDLRIRDEVLVSYNADVMGYLYKDDTCVPNPDGKKIKLPKRCVNCEEPLIIVKDMLKCTNEDCPGQQIGRILEVIRILDIDFFGEETAQALTENGITNAIDFISMDRDTLAKVLVGKNLDKAWKQFRDKIEAEIDYAKVVDLLRVPSLRTKTARKILDHIGVTKFLSLMVGSATQTGQRYLAKSLTEVPGINKNATGFAEGLAAKLDEFNRLVGLLNVVEGTQPVFDKMVLVSGFRRDDTFEEICKKLNYGVTDSGKYDILVVTQDRLDGSKARAARKSGKPIYTLPEFISKYK